MIITLVFTHTGEDKDKADKLEMSTAYPLSVV